MKTINETLKCEICGIKVKKENAIYFYKDICVNHNYSDFTNIYCKGCAKENNLLEESNT